MISIHDGRSSREGSASLEACILLPALLLVLMFGIRLAQTYAAYNCLERAVLKTGRLMADYGILYHEYGIEQLENKALSFIGDSLSAKTGETEGKGILSGLGGLRAAAEAGDDLLYAQAASALCGYYLERDPVIRSGFVSAGRISFGGSRFFDGGDDIELRAVMKLFGKLNIGTSLRVRAWIRGDDPLLALNESGITVWQLGNFARGKILRALFGATLPYDYPVICSMEGGEALMIKSLNTTAASYKDGKRLESEVRDMINRLSDFRGGDGDNISSKGYPVFSEAEIRSRKLILVVPEEGFNEKQAEKLRDLIVYASSKGIRFETVPYQKALGDSPQEETEERDIFSPPQ